MLFFGKNKKIQVQDTDVSIKTKDGQDYISLTDMLKSKDGDFFVSDWLRNRNTVEFLGVWESMNNPNFNYGGFAAIKEKAGLNNYKISVKEWIEKTNAIGLIANSGRYGGTYAHVDIAFEFGMWISPQFKLYLIKEYQRLKQVESNQYNLEWNVKRMISKTNYNIHTDAIKEIIIPQTTHWMKSFEYAKEADLLNLSIFGMTAKEWKEQNPERDKRGENMRDSASIVELIVISNAESLNAEMIKEGKSKKERFEKIQQMAKDQMKILAKNDSLKSLKKTKEDVYLTAMETKDKKSNPL